MKKRMSLSILLSFLLTTVVAVSTIPLAQADIDGTPVWVGPKYDKDDFFGLAATFIAFQTGTTATLRVTVTNPSATEPLNISAVKILMDWNINYSSTEASQTSPKVIQKTGFGLTYYYTFTVAFLVPDITVASNLFRHRYWIYVEEVNATTGPQKVSIDDVDSGSDFTVYSADQVTAQNTRVEYETTLSGFSPTSKEALELKKNAELHALMAASSYKNGDFAGAKTHYLTALDSLTNARDTEQVYQTTVQDNSLALTVAQTKQAEAQAKYYEGQAKYQEGLGAYYNKTGDAAMIEANATMKMADAQWALAQAANLQATALNLFGFGFILFGAAAIIWAFKRPKPPT
jgi:hypothetical protein